MVRKRRGVWRGGDVRISRQTCACKPTRLSSPAARPVSDAQRHCSSHGRARPNVAEHCAPKGAVVLRTKPMAVDHGPQNVRVKCISPGDTDTAIRRSEAKQMGEREDRFLAEAARRLLGRLSKP